METSETKRTENNRTEPKRTQPSSPQTKPAIPASVMATVSSSSVPQSTVQMDMFAGTEPKDVVSERKVSVQTNLRYWANLYDSVRMASAAEPARLKLRTAVYTYCAINGTSRAGEYSTSLTTADGTTFNSSAIAKACNVRDIRKWMRTNDAEAVTFFRTTGVLEKNSVMVQRALSKGFGADAVIGVVDFVSDCPLLTVNELRLNTISFDVSIQRARGARDGKSLENVERANVEQSLEAQNGAPEHGKVLYM